MTPEQVQQTMQSLVRMSLRTAQISAGLTLALWKEGLLTEKAAEGFSIHLRDLAETLEQADDHVAAEFATAANLLLRPSPKAQG